MNSLCQDDHEEFCKILDNIFEINSKKEIDSRVILKNIISSSYVNSQYNNNKCPARCPVRFMVQLLNAYLNAMCNTSEVKIYVQNKFTSVEKKFICMISLMFFNIAKYGVSDNNSRVINGYTHSNMCDNIIDTMIVHILSDDYKQGLKPASVVNLGNKFNNYISELVKTYKTICLEMEVLSIPNFNIRRLGEYDVDIVNNRLMFWKNLYGILVCFVCRRIGIDSVVDTLPKIREYEKIIEKYGVILANASIPPFVNIYDHINIYSNSSLQYLMNFITFKDVADSLSQQKTIESTNARNMALDDIVIYRNNNTGFDPALNETLEITTQLIKKSTGPNRFSGGNNFNQYNNPLMDNFKNYNPNIQKIY
ncbi:MAG: hypothetical protein KDH96_09590 [Candidatus Riesia sp.]|nr:hypothetical protein [Candidatus Riesia sp.]